MYEYGIKSCKLSGQNSAKYGLPRKIVANFGFLCVCNLRYEICPETKKLLELGSFSTNLEILHRRLKVNRLRSRPPIPYCRDSLFSLSASNWNLRRVRLQHLYFPSSDLSQ
jgi:hypothetical protein